MRDGDGGKRPSSLPASPSIPGRGASHGGGPAAGASQGGAGAASASPPAIPSVSAAALRGLAACAQCQMVFPAARLTDHRGRLLCSDCGRNCRDCHLEVDGGDVPPLSAIEPLRPSYDARMVSSAVSAAPPTTLSGQQFSGRYRPRPNPALSGFQDDAPLADPPAVVAPGVSAPAAFAPPPAPAAAPAVAPAPSFGGPPAAPPAPSADAPMPTETVLDLPPVPTIAAAAPDAPSLPPAPPPPPPPATSPASSAPAVFPRMLADRLGDAPVAPSFQRADRGSPALPPWAQQPAAPAGGPPASVSAGGVLRASAVGRSPSDPPPALPSRPVPVRSGSSAPHLPAVASRPPDLPPRPSTSSSRSGTGAPRGTGPRPSHPGFGAPVSVADVPPPLPPPPAASAFPAASPPAADPRARSQGNAADRFDHYAELRQRIDGGEDVLETRRRAAEMAARLGLHLEAVEHYRRCVELAPDDESLKIKLENVTRSVGAAQGGTAGGTANDSQRRVVEEAKPFWDDLGAAFAYPLRGAGLAVLLVGGVFFGIGQLVASINVFATAVNVMLWGYVAAYLFDVINATAAGKSDPPELPEATNVLESYVFPFFAFCTCAAVSFAPFLLCGFAAFRGWLPGGVAAVLLLATFALGFFTMPMALTVRAMFQSVGEAAKPAFVLGSIGRIFPDYLAMFVATCLLWVAFAAAYGVAFFVCTLTLGAPHVNAVLAMDASRIASWVLFTVLTWPLFLYAWTFQGHLLGRLYRQSLRRLGWFAPPTDQYRAARKLSAGLALGAGASLLLLVGAAWAAGAALQRQAATPNAAFGASCPIGDGARLVYFWEHTDGMAGLTEYRFLGQADGTVRVTSTTHVAGQPGPGSEETLGIFDPETGVWTEAAAAWGQGVHYDGKRGEHVAFFGPKKAELGGAYLNDWPVKGSDRWQSVWPSWRVRHEASTRDLFYDTRTGVLVGSRFNGVGFVVTSWLTKAENVAGLLPGPAPNRNFDVASPDDGGFDALDGR